MLYEVITHITILNLLFSKYSINPLNAKTINIVKIDWRKLTFMNVRTDNAKNIIILFRIVFNFSPPFNDNYTLKMSKGEVVFYYNDKCHIKKWHLTLNINFKLLYYNYRRWRRGRDMIVKIENLVKRYGDLLALDHLNLEINEGEIFGLLGPNSYNFV